eukprot:scaffold49315_cov18-Tisochrysis_lutea.AAC.3
MECPLMAEGTHAAFRYIPGRKETKESQPEGRAHKGKVHPDPEGKVHNVGEEGFRTLLDKQMPDTSLHFRAARKSIPLYF